MAAFRAASVAACLLVFGADALRKTSRSEAQDDDKNTDVVENVTGIVAGLYTWGAPGVSDPPLKNPLAADGCFSGKRSWNRRKSWGISWVDPVATIAGFRGFRHPYVEGVRIDVGKEAWRIEACDENIITRPNPRGTGYWSYHSARLYRNATEWIGQDFFDFTYVATKYSMKYSDAFVVEDAPQWGGWRLVGRGLDDGESELLGGPHVSNLFQQPYTLDCIVTFQGTRDTADWFANFDARHVDYCGLTGTTVHAGFRNHLRRMVRDPSWQEEVRPRLAQCANVNIAGHSLGGAVATLFSACVNSGNVGDEDFDSISWIKAVKPAMMLDFGSVVE